MNQPKPITRADLNHMLRELTQKIIHAKTPEPDESLRRERRKISELIVGVPYDDSNMIYPAVRSGA